jgi:hypothetical protein
MSFNVRKLPNDAVFALVAASNQQQTDAIGSFFHRDRTCASSHQDFRSPTVTRVTVTAATASSEGTSVTLANDIKAALNLHFADSVAHSTALSAAIATADATDVTTAITLGNACKAAFNTHRTESNVHFNNDSTNAVAATNASDQSSLNTLLNEMKGDINAHLASAPTGVFINLVNP